MFFNQIQKATLNYSCSFSSVPLLVSRISTCHIKATFSIITYISAINLFFFLSLTCIPEFFIPVHGQDDEDIAQDVHDDGEDQHAGQRSGHSTGGSTQVAAAVITGQTVRPVHIFNL